MSYTPADHAEFDRQIGEMIETYRQKKLTAEEVFHVFKLIPDREAALMLMALMLVRLEKVESKLAALRKDGLAF